MSIIVPEVNAKNPRMGPVLRTQGGMWGAAGVEVGSAVRIYLGFTQGRRF